MKTIITYITDDGKEFTDGFQAKRHECELTEHNWEYYDQIMSLQKKLTNDTRVKFCRNCSKQVVLKKQETTNKIQPARTKQESISYN